MNNQQRDQQSPFSDDIDILRKTQERLNESVENSEDVKSGTTTVDDEKKEPGYRIYNEIMETTINILQSDTMASTFGTIAEQLNPEVTKALVTSISLAMTHSAYNAIILYDKMIKEELQKSFNTIGNGLNELSGTVNGHHGAIKVFKHRLEELERVVGIEKKPTT